MSLMITTGIAQPMTLPRAARTRTMTGADAESVADVHRVALTSCVASRHRVPASSRTCLERESRLLVPDQGATRYTHLAEDAGVSCMCSERQQYDAWLMTNNP